MSVKSKGDAFINIMDSHQYSVIFQHSVTSIEPTRGSFGGGTIVTVSGFGLDVGTLGVYLDDDVTGESSRVEIVERNYTTMRVRTPEMSKTKQQSVVKQFKVEDSTYEEWEQHLGNPLAMKFHYEDNDTAVMLNVTPSEYDTLGSIMMVQLHSIPKGYQQKDITVSVGGLQAEVTNFVNQTVYAIIPALSNGEHTVTVAIGRLGHVYINRTLTNATVIAKPNVKEVFPSSGSIHGNQRFVVKGYGFVANMVHIRIGNNRCECDNVTTTEAHCVTPSGSGIQTVFVVEGWRMYPEIVKYTYHADMTPIITTISPSIGVGGDLVTITGNNFLATSKDDYQVSLGMNANHTIESISEQIITLRIGAHRAGTENLKISVRGYGDSNGKFSIESFLWFTIR